MNGRLELTSPSHAHLSLRAIGEGDLENLRNWKNENRKFFFFTGIITPEGQHQWFSQYREREDDAMFIVHAEGQDIGCMGVRWLDEENDVYNVILGVENMGGKGWMSKALTLLCTYAQQRSPRVGLKVLRDNPAVGWYLRNNFIQDVAYSDYLHLVLDHAKFQPCPLREQSLSQQPEE